MSATRRRPNHAFTLLEVLIVVAILGVLAGIIVPSSNPDTYARLEAMAGILGRNIEYARNLAVTNSDNYKITFDVPGNQWILTHCGSNAALDDLPITPFHLASDPPDQQIVLLDEMSHVAETVRLHAIWELTTPPETVDAIEFHSLGETMRTVPTLIWLASGTGTGTRYISVRVSPITGVYWIEGYRATEPTTATY